MIDEAEVVLRSGVARRWPGAIAVFGPGSESSDVEGASDVAALVEIDGLIDVVARGAGVVRIDDRVVPAGALPIGATRVELSVGEAASDIELPVAERLVVDLRDVEAVPPAEPLAVIENAPVAADAAATTGVIVEGIECSRGHFNDPRAAYCMVCGISMVHLTHRLVRNTRPTLGFAVFDDGSTFALDRSYLVGRTPTGREEPDWAPLTLEDSTVSGTHGEIRLVEWDIEIADLGSTNGTRVWDPMAGAWQTVTETAPVRLTPGTTVAFGHRTFVFESVHRTG